MMTLEKTNKTVPRYYSQISNMKETYQANNTHTFYLGIKSYSIFVLIWPKLLNISHNSLDDEDDRRENREEYIAEQQKIT